MLIILIYSAGVSMLSMRARVVKTNQSELFQKSDLRKWMPLTRLERVRFGVNKYQI